ncbi:MBL fold metallo-hydrolase [Simplicispira suum]|uniref:MBL fold metallo-hydrolase n=1 Tax=Simplicispira suum TaxID=2109915 RepID=A0A2S0N4F8_9BURK|nr:MBL fold metallo-hydrolase [Simplicispira suum]AVO43030.1 MBL fold metallo-hydrolase [Simplicispira suum]
MAPSITFLGAASTVTGSKYLVRHEGHCALVDCGLFQGYKQLRLRNWQPLGVAPAQIDAVLLTHAHLDHSGYLPLLARDGFHGAVHATAATRELCGILLPDSGHLQEEDAAYLNRHHLSKHSPALPLYTRLDAQRCLRQFHSHALHRSFEPVPGWRATFSSAGHILGAASILLEVGGHRILFSGDLGRDDDLVMAPPEAPPQADTVLVESTYGDRQHPPENMVDELGAVLAPVAKRGGVAVVPVFAVGRAQSVLHAINLLKTRGTLPRQLPVFLDSPMAVNTTALFAQHPQAHRLSTQEVHALSHSATMVQTTEDSKALAKRHGPMVILSASGMATGGRVLHHLALYSGDHRNLIVLTGHQAPGTRGARIAAGEKSIRIHGQDVAIRAQVAQIDSASAHADSDQTLAWLRRLDHAPRKVFVVHGEMAAADRLRERIAHELHWRALVPEQGAVHSL